MAILDDLAKGATPETIAIGVGAVLLTPVLAPIVTSVLRPAAKTVLRTGISLYRSAAEPLGAAVGSLVTEAQLELASARSASTNAASADTSKHRGGQR